MNDYKLYKDFLADLPLYCHGKATRLLAISIAVMIEYHRPGCSFTVFAHANIDVKKNSLMVTPQVRLFLDKRNGGVASIVGTHINYLRPYDVEELIRRNL